MPELVLLINGSANYFLWRAVFPRQGHQIACERPVQGLTWLWLMQDIDDDDAKGDKGKSSGNAALHNGDSAAGQDSAEDSSSASPMEPPVRPCGCVMGEMILITSMRYARSPHRVHIHQWLLGLQADDAIVCSAHSTH